MNEIVRIGGLEGFELWWLYTSKGGGYMLFVEIYI